MRKSNKIPFKAKPRFAIIVDGECEFWYINMIKRNERSIRVDLKPEIPQRKKLIELFNKVKELSNDYDKVFWIVDFDVILSESRVTKKGLKSSLQEFNEYQTEINNNFKNVVIIINNPCLEYWFLLHFESTTKFFDTCKSSEKALIKHLKDYEKTEKYYTKQDNDIYQKLKSQLKNACLNASKPNKFNSSNNYYTGISQMHLLFNKITN